MDILADENVPAPIIARLRLDGWTVSAVTDLGPGESNLEVAARAALSNKVLLTQDRDFGELAVVHRTPIAGVNLMELERLSLVLQVARVSSFLRDDALKIPGHFTVLEPTRVRRRAL